jgi:chemotaxis protein CheD
MEVAIIHPGEFFATQDDVIISTVLGSCISVAFFDRVRHFGGLNHFMLPGNANAKEGFYLTESGKYGMFAMELLINELIKQGARKDALVAKVFGGGHVLKNATGTAVGSVPQGNIEFALKYLETEKIPIESSDIGGYEARKIFFFPRTNKILLKRITGKLITSVEAEEEEYLEKIRKEAEKKKKENITLF